MFNKKEISIILVVSIILAFTITLVETLDFFLYTLLGIFILILVNTIAKKITSFSLDSEIEVKLWEFRKYGFKKNQRLKKPFPAGIFIPIVSKILLFPFNGFIWMASLVFETKAKVYRAAKRHGMYSFSEMTEDHIGLIAASGIFANLILALIGYLMGFPFFAKLNIWFALFNMIPISDLDGNKIFFANITLWSFLSIITLIGFLYSILLV